MLGELTVQGHYGWLVKTSRGEQLCCGSGAFQLGLQPANGRFQQAEGRRRVLTVLQSVAHVVCRLGAPEIEQLRYLSGPDPAAADLGRKWTAVSCGGGPMLKCHLHVEEHSAKEEQVLGHLQTKVLHGLGTAEESSNTTGRDCWDGGRRRLLEVGEELQVEPVVDRLVVTLAGLNGHHRKPETLAGGRQGYGRVLPTEQHYGHRVDERCADGRGSRGSWGSGALQNASKMNS